MLFFEEEGDWVAFMGSLMGLLKREIGNGNNREKVRIWMPKK